METVRDVLLAERARAGQRAAALDKEFAGIAEAASEPGTDDEHDPEGATLAFERQHTAALRERALEQIEQIDAALARLDVGTYGTCVRCGGPVGDDRLAARPEAATCLRCASRLAKGGPAVSIPVSATPTGLQSGWCHTHRNGPDPGRCFV